MFFYKYIIFMFVFVASVLHEGGSVINDSCLEKKAAQGKSARATLH